MENNDIMEKFIKADVLKKAISITDIKIFDIPNLISEKDIKLGSVSWEGIRENKAKISEKEKILLRYTNQFVKKCLKSLH